MKLKKTTNTEKRTRQRQIRPTKLKEWLTSHDVFLNYRYKQQRIKTNSISGKISVFQPYISNEDSSDHEFALQFPEWEKVIQTYFDITRENLQEGVDVVFPREMGYLSMKKIKKAKPTMRKDKRFLNLSTLGYSPKMIWVRNFERTFAHKMWYIFNLSRRYQWSHVGKALKKDASIIFKWDDVKHK